MLYPDDINSDVGLELCRPFVYGIWVKTIFKVLFFSPKKGALLTPSGIQMDYKMLSKVLGFTEDEVKEAWNDWVKFGVCSILEDGTLINRKMFYDEERRKEISEIRREASLSKGKQKPSKRIRKPKQTPVLVYSVSVGDSVGVSENDFVRFVISDLNEKAKTNYQETTEPYRKAIKDRVGEGYNLENFKHVHTVKCNEWIGTDYEKHLNPDTLYRATNFPKYLNQRGGIRPKSKTQELIDHNQRVSEEWLADKMKEENTTEITHAKE